MTYQVIQWFDKQGRTIKEKTFDKKSHNILHIIKFHWLSDSVVMTTCYFPQKDSASRFLQYDKNNMELYEVLLSNDYKSKYYTTKIKLILDKNMRCKEYVYYDYLQKPFLNHFRFTYISDNEWITKNDTIMEDNLIKKIIHKVARVAKKENSLGFRNQSIDLFDYDKEKRLSEKKEIYCFRPEFIDTIIINYSYTNDNQIKNIIKKRRTDTTLYEKEEYFYTESGKLNRKIRIDSYGIAFEDEYLTQKDTSIYKRYITNTAEEGRRLEHEEYLYKGRKFLAKYYDTDNKFDFWAIKIRYQKRFFRF